jgi:uncharacterized damage-inducible protein DinB
LSIFKDAETIRQMPDSIIIERRRLTMNEHTFRQNLIDILTGENAHVSLASTLKNLKPENRDVIPSPGLHSIWQQLEHIRICQEDIVQYILDPNWKSPSWPEGYWPDKNSTATEKMWIESINRFNDDLQKLVSIINDPKIDLTSIIPHTKKHTYLREVLIVIDHNSYHTAQIVQTRKTLDDW